MNDLKKDIPYNELPLLPVKPLYLETVPVLTQVTKSTIACRIEGTSTYTP